LKYIKQLMTVIGLMAIWMLTACGSSNESPSASLSLAVDRTSVASNDSFVATVTLTPLSQTSTTALNGVKVKVLSSDNSVIADANGTTDPTGTANIVLRTKTTNIARSVTLVAAADGATQSSSVQITVTPDGALTVSLPEESTYDVKGGVPGGITRIVMSGSNMKFVNNFGNPVLNQLIELHVKSITNKATDDRVVFVLPGQGEITAPPGWFSDSTDLNGTIFIPMEVDATIPAAGSQHVFTINWEAVTTYNGLPYTVTGQSMITITNAE